MFCGDSTLIIIFSLGLSALPLQREVNLISSRPLSILGIILPAKNHICRIKSSATSRLGWSTPTLHETLDFLDPEKEYYKFVGRGIGRGWGERVKDRGGSGERERKQGTTFGFTCLVFSCPD